MINDSGLRSHVRRAMDPNHSQVLVGRPCALTRRMVLRFHALRQWLPDGVPISSWWVPPHLLPGFSEGLAGDRMNRHTNGKAFVYYANVDIVQRKSRTE